jgi:hypothetical protein
MPTSVLDFCVAAEMARQVAAFNLWIAGSNCSVTTAEVGITDS